MVKVCDCKMALRNRYRTDVPDVFLSLSSQQGLLGRLGKDPGVQHSHLAIHRQHITVSHVASDTLSQPSHSTRQLNCRLTSGYCSLQCRAHASPANLSSNTTHSVDYAPTGTAFAVADRMHSVLYHCSRRFEAPELSWNANANWSGDAFSAFQTRAAWARIGHSNQQACQLLQQPHQRCCWSAINAGAQGAAVRMG